MQGGVKRWVTASNDLSQYRASSGTAQPPFNPSPPKRERERSRTQEGKEEPKTENSDRNDSHHC